MKKFKNIFLMLTIYCYFLFCGLVYADNVKIHDTVNILIQNGQFDKAEKLSKEYIKNNPNDPEGHCSLACVYRNSALKTALNIDSSAAGIKDGKTGSFEFNKDNFSEIFQEQSFFHREEYKKAEEIYLNLITANPEHRNAYFNLLNDYSKMEEFDNYFKIINLYIQNLKDQKGSLYPLQDLARKLYSGKYYNQAMKLFTIIVDNYPDAIESKSDIGAIFVQQGEIIKAKSIFQEVSKLSPEDIINLKNYYITLLLTKDFNNAYNVKSSIEKLESGKSSHLYDKIFLSILLKKDYKFYIKEYLKKRELEIKDKRNDFWYQSSNALLNYENLSTKDAVELLEGYLIQFHQAKYTDLSLTVANIIENIQITNNALIVQTAIYDQYNYYEQTIKYLDKIKKRKETDPTIMSDYDMNWNYGRIQYAKEKYDLAKDYFLANQKNNKKDAKINYYLGKCYLFLGKKKEAKELFEFNSKMNDKEQMHFINYSIRELKNL